MNGGSVQGSAAAPVAEGDPAVKLDPSPSGARRVRVLKFGGTSLETEERFASVVRRVKEVLEEGARPVVVVSAVGGTTDSLEAAVGVTVAGEAGRGRGRLAPDELEAVHQGLLLRLAPQAEQPELQARVAGLFREIEKLVQGVELVGECSPRTRDRLLSYGELLSSLLVSAGLRASGVGGRAVDARGLIRSDARFGAAAVDREVSVRRIRESLLDDGSVPVVTGFLASTSRGETTTLGRGASDLTATLVGAALDAEMVEIWTDVGGIHTADPRSVPLAQPLHELSYDELLELANFGAKVMCPLAVEPVRDAGIPVRILSTLDPSLPGTRVVTRPGTRSRPVRGISAIPGAALLRLEGVERIGVSEAAERLYHALRAAEVRPLLFTQDSSAHSLSVAVAGDGLPGALAAVREEFERERKAGMLGEPVAQEGRSVLALVGEGMRDTPGISGRLFSVLGRAGVNVHAIAQGSSERNISWVVSSDDEGKALRTVHDAFLSGQDTHGGPVHRRGTAGPAMSADEVTAFAPATVGNLNCGFDVLGLALERPGDRITARATGAPGIRIRRISGDDGRLPHDPRRNGAGAAAAALLRAEGRSDGVELDLAKGVPLSGGMGGSAASAAAAVVAVDRLLGLGSTPETLLRSALAGEEVSSGGHADNLAPSLFGGIMLVRASRVRPLVRLPVPDGLTVALLHPALEMNTRDARQRLGDSVPLPSAVAQWGNTAALVAALHAGDWELMADALVDRVAEPHRAPRIPGFQAVRSAAREAGAVGCGISGAGPSLFALCRSAAAARQVGRAMDEAFRDAASLPATLHVSAVATRGARVLA